LGAFRQGTQVVRDKEEMILGLENDTRLSEVPGFLEGRAIYWFSESVLESAYYYGT